jgi:hypothetical protein
MSTSSVIGRLDGLDEIGRHNLCVDDDWLHASLMFASERDNIIDELDSDTSAY